MFKLKMTGFLAFVAIASACPSLGVADSRVRRANCGPILEPSRELENDRQKMRTADQNLSGLAERRIKILISGRREDAVDTIDKADLNVDFADPSLTMRVVYPDGRTVYRIGASGLRYIEANSPEDFYRGGIFKVQRSRGFYPDGSEMTGAYHNEAWSWDVVVYQNDKQEWIALGGTMPQPGPGQLPNVRDHNPRRSRWFGIVKHVRNFAGEYEEHIHWQKPVHDFNRVRQVGWNYHGYGGTLLTKWNPQTKIHEPIRLSNGNYLLFYERVTEQRRTQDGKAVPYMTTMFSREMKPSITETVGTEYPASQIESPLTGKPFKATKRGLEDQDEGYLAEGGNVFMTEANQPIKAFSANDYVRRYGIYLDYLPAGADPRGVFRPVLDDEGELIDFAERMNLRQKMNATWLGRPQLERDPWGRLWMKFHFVPIETIPTGAPVEGWPDAKDFPHYGRITAIAPVKLTVDKRGQPNLELDEDQ